MTMPTVRCGAAVPGRDLQGVGVGGSGTAGWTEVMASFGCALLEDREGQQVCRLWFLVAWGATSYRHLA